LEGEGEAAKIPNKLLAKDEDLNSWGPKLAKLASEALASFTWSSMQVFEDHGPAS